MHILQAQAEPVRVLLLLLRHLTVRLCSLQQQLQTIALTQYLQQGPAKQQQHQQQVKRWLHRVWSAPLMCLTSC
jgi:hypothetical protein